MCLHDITQKYNTDNAYTGVGYKVLALNNRTGEWEYPVITDKKPDTTGGWNEVDEYVRITNDRHSYEAGFHVWLDKEDAFRYAKRIAGWGKINAFSQDVTVFQVEWKNIIAEGTCVVKINANRHETYDVRVKLGNVVVVRNYRVMVGEQK